MFRERQLGRIRLVSGLAPAGPHSQRKNMIAILVVAALFGSAGFVGGLLVGRRNSEKVNEVVKAVVVDAKKL